MNKLLISEFAHLEYVNDSKVLGDAWKPSLAPALLVFPLGSRQSFMGKRIESVV